MFGSSEDRARQLAARHRRERQSSSGTNGSQRATSSSSQSSAPPESRTQRDLGATQLPMHQGQSGYASQQLVQTLSQPFPIVQGRPGPLVPIPQGQLNHPRIRRHPGQSQLYAPSGWQSGPTIHGHRSLTGQYTVPNPTNSQGDHRVRTTRKFSAWYEPLPPGIALGHDSIYSNSPAQYQPTMTPFNASVAHYPSHIAYTDSSHMRMPLRYSSTPVLGMTGDGPSDLRSFSTYWIPFVVHCRFLLFQFLQCPATSLDTLYVVYQWLTFSCRYFTGGGGSAAAPAGKGNVNKLFDSYRDDVANEPDVVGPEGSMKYIEKLGVNPEGLEVLAVLETIQAPTMGEMSREGFVEGWLAVKYGIFSYILERNTDLMAAAARLSTSKRPTSNPSSRHCRPTKKPSPRSTSTRSS
jgi:hypothetical protein